MRIEFIDKIKSTLAKFGFESLATYESVPVTADLVDGDIPSWKNVNDIIGSSLPGPVVINIPANSQTPIVIDFTNSTIKIGSESAASVGADLAKYKDNPDLLFEAITSPNNTSPKPTEPWITNKQWSNSTYTILEVLTIQPDTDTGASGGLTLDDINIIIKP